MLNVVDEGLFKFSDRDIRKVSHIRILQEEGLIALLAGKYLLYNHYIVHVVLVCYLSAYLCITCPVHSSIIK